MREAKMPELKERAKDLGIEGADGMKKADLLAAIEKAELESSDSGPEKVESTEVSEPVESQPLVHDHNHHLAKHPKFSKFNSHGGK